MRFAAAAVGGLAALAIQYVPVNSIRVADPEQIELPADTPVDVAADNVTEQPCGQLGTSSAAGFSAQIVKGEGTSACEYRWQVGLSSGISSSPFCGGMLIDKEWVLTAAHCVVSDDGRVTSTRRVYVQAGELDWLTAQRRGVRSIHPHPGYDPKTKNHDLALLKLSFAVTLGNCVGTVCLPKKGHDAKPGQKWCKITGYGRVENGGQKAGELLVANVRPLANWVCRHFRMYWSWNIKHSMLCAQGRRGWFKTQAEDTCQGDSGGPMVCEENGAWTAYGVTSFGRGCGNPFFPGVYARIHYHLDWIYETMGGKR